MANDRVTRAKILTTMFTAYGASGDTDRITVYVKVFEGMPVEVLDAACRKCMYEKPFLPAIAEILQAAQNIVEETRATRVLSWGEAWAEIEHKMQGGFFDVTGQYILYEDGNLKFSTAELAATVEAIGWRNLCNCAAKDFPIVRAQVRKIYEDITKRKRESEVNMMVMGHKRLVELVDHIKLLY